MTLVVATCFWDANENTPPNSRCFDESWVVKLAAGFARNLTVAHRFYVFTDQHRDLPDEIRQQPLISRPINFGSFTEPYRLNEPMILVGLDTLVIGNIDHMAHYCLTADKIALSRDPYKPDQSINGVALAPAGQRAVWDEWRGENDMTWLRQRDTAFIDDLFPGEVLSFKAHDIRRKGKQGARIIYFHGQPKPHELPDDKLVRKHWRA
jgi:hypothetical protein